MLFFFFFKQKTAYEIKECDWSSDVCSSDLTTMNFINELAPARTFGFLRDVEMLKSKGLARGGSLENAIVLGDREVINGGELRFKDEFVRHKILDAVGDISLIGLPIYGHIIANKSGHTLHVKLLRKILLNRNAWEISSEPVAATPALGLAAQIQTGLY